MRRLDSILLTGVGVLLVHQAAYTVSSLIGVKTAVAHGHLEIAWLIASLTTVGALARAVTQSLRRRHYETGQIVVLTAWILGGYLALESVERLANGLSALSLLGEPVFWLGLLFAPIVALVLQWSMRTVARVVTNVVGRPGLPSGSFSGASSLADTSVTLTPSIFFSFAVSRRGPPHLSSI